MKEFACGCFPDYDRPTAAGGQESTVGAQIHSLDIAGVPSGHERFNLWRAGLCWSSAEQQQAAAKKQFKGG